MKTAVIYARYSSERHTEQSIEGQFRVCHEFAERNDLKIINTYIDRAMTVTNDNRAAFQKMLSDSDKPQPWEIVLVYALDRFGRNSIEVSVNKQRLQNNGKILISATQRTSVNIDGTQNLDSITPEKRSDRSIGILLRQVVPEDWPRQRCRLDVGRYRYRKQHRDHHRVVFNVQGATNKVTMPNDRSIIVKVLQSINE